MIGMRYTIYVLDTSLTYKIDNPLAKGFDITAGHVDIVVPDVEPRNDYVIARMSTLVSVIRLFLIPIRWLKFSEIPETFLLSSQLRQRRGSPLL